MNQGRDIERTSETITETAVSECNCRIVPSGTVLLSFKLSIGKVGIARRPLYTNEAIAALPIKAHSRLSPDFLYWALRSTDLRNDRDRAAKGLTLNLEKLKRIEIALPPLAEQFRIAEILDKADALRAKRRAALAQLDTLTQAMFIDMFGDPATNPKDWPVMPLGDCAERIQIGPFGSLLHRDDYVDGGIPLVNPMHIQAGRITPSFKESIAAAKFAQLTAYHLQTGDIVMGRRGEMGRCAIVSDDSGPLLCGTGSLFIRPREGRTTSLFLKTVLSGGTMKAKLENLALGQTLPNLNQTIVSGVRIPVPPVALQNRFAARVLATWSLGSAQRASILQLDALFASLQHRAFRGEL
jgi:type I restriction enzyme S subunit